MFQPVEFTTSELIFSFIFSVLMGFLAAYYAEKKGRSTFAWFILGFMFTIFALIVLYFLPSLKVENSEQTVTKPFIVNSDPLLKNSTESIIPLPFEVNPEENKLWFYLDENHQQLGPVSIIALRDLWNRNLIDVTTFVWTDKMEKWEKIQELPELQDTLNKEKS